MEHDNAHCQILVNGHKTSLINVLDRGLQYGDGLFETIAIIDGKPLIWERHLERLWEGCGRLGIPEPDPALVTGEAQELCAGQSRCVLKIIITRGVGGRGYRAQRSDRDTATNSSTRILSLHPWPDYPQEYATHGIRLRQCHTRLGINPALAGIKHLNRLEQVVARGEWNDPDIPEGLMLDSEGNVIEGTFSNLFIVDKGVLITPDLSGSGVDGVMRGLILDIAGSLAVPSRITKLQLDNVRRADEVFLCNALINIWPVRIYEDVHYDNFEITRFIMTELEKQLVT